MPARRKSTKVHEFLGNRIHDRRSEDDSKIPASRPKCPPNVNRTLFKKVCAQLEERRALTSGDLQLIRLLCVLTERHERALTALIRDGEIVAQERFTSAGDPYTAQLPSPWLKVAETSERAIISCLDRLGLTPLSRDKIRPTSGDGEPPLNADGVVPGSVGELFFSGKARSTEAVVLEPPLDIFDEVKRED